ncbi:hypothetical protein Mal64_37650 [Pseudobythopirellula maris]|uniref:DUF1559 domain-containing protein n=1 Tax=Pseudobythopirellula maris TaxID=2527991 RepID=A0A5C5ZIJ1_9BACT|nr:DUF1559 domain-containing protein [Pseudobythopirellula maris]TWT86935.1 hypothetical protein Mal64_37650 [Pseudobythopirellula maris]
MLRAPSGFSRTDLLGAVLAALLLGSLLLPALAATSGNADRTFCLQQMRTLGLAMFRHHDAFLALPLASSQPFDHAPGSADPKRGAGYSWLAKMMPFIEENVFYDRLSRASDRFQKAPFDADLLLTPPYDETRPYEVEFSRLVCPAYGGESRVAGEHDYAGLAGLPPAVSSYHAFAGSHLYRTEDGVLLDDPEQELVGGAHSGNGLIAFPGLVGGRVNKRGRSYAAVTDGRRHTLVFAETIEPAYSALIDGQAAWMVASWPAAEPPTLQPREGGEKQLTWADPGAGARLTSLRDRSFDAAADPYLKASYWKGAHDRRWGPSSNHPGVVGHAFADGSVRTVSTDVDPNLYVRLVTPSGSDDGRQGDLGLPSADRPRSARPIPAVQLSKLPWSPIEWSPLYIGDLELRFPQDLSLERFRPDKLDRNIAHYGGDSRVFSRVDYLRNESAFLLVVAEKYAEMASSAIYGQLSKALQSPGEKALDSSPKRVLWSKEAEWDGGSARFEFELVDADGATPPRLLIRLVADAVPAGGGGPRAKLTPEGTTYFAVDAAPRSVVPRAIRGYRITPFGEHEFVCTPGDDGSLAVAVLAPPGSLHADWRLVVRAPAGTKLTKGSYKDAVGYGTPAAQSHDGRSSMRFSADMRVVEESTGWFDVHEIAYSPDGRGVERLSLDFVSIEPGDRRTFGRLRLGATIDPVPTEDEIHKAMLGEVEWTRYKAGYRKKTSNAFDKELTSYHANHGEYPADLGELRREIPSTRFFKVSPRDAGHKELWYDPELGRLYLKPVGADVP